MVTIAFTRGNLKDVIGNALKREAQNIAERLNAVSTMIANESLLVFRGDAQLKDFQDFTGNARQEMFVSSSTGYLQTMLLKPLRDKLEAGEQVFLSAPLEGTARRIVGKADIISQSNFLRFKVDPKGESSMAVMRTGWPLEYLGMWKENAVSPHYYITQMRKDVIAVVHNIKRFYRTVALRVRTKR